MTFHPGIPAKIVLDSPCPECGGGYRQDCADGPQLIPHESGCDVYDDILDRLAAAIAYGILLAAVAEYGVTRHAHRAAQLAVIGSDAFERSADARAVRDH